MKCTEAERVVTSLIATHIQHHHPSLQTYPVPESFCTKVEMDFDSLKVRDESRGKSDSEVLSLSLCSIQFKDGHHGAELAKFSWETRAHEWMNEWHCTVVLRPLSCPMKAMLCSSKIRIWWRERAEAKFGSCQLNLLTNGQDPFGMWVTCGKIANSLSFSFLRKIVFLAPPTHSRLFMGAHARYDTNHRISLSLTYQWTCVSFAKAMSFSLDAAKTFSPGKG